jgi:hypothetical protein
MQPTGVRLEGLFFETGAYRLSKKVSHFSLPAGWSCPFAGNCMTKVNHGQLERYGSRFTCFAAVQEYDHTIASRRWHNFNTLECASEEEMVELLLHNLPATTETLLVHYSGDFFSADYFRAWMEVARRRPDMRFAAQTTSIDYWVKNRHLVPTNFHLVASVHSSQNRLIKEHNLQYSAVVFSEEELKDFGLKANTYDLLLDGTKDINLGVYVCSLQQEGTAALTAAVSMRTGSLDESRHSASDASVHMPYEENWK